MRVECKSLLITKTDVQRFADKIRIHTTYDMSSVRDHTFDLPLLLHRMHLRYFPAAVAVIFLLLWALQIGIRGFGGFGFDAASLPKPCLVLVGLVIGALYSYSKVSHQVVREAVARERDFAADAAFQVVDTTRWDKFVAQLQ